nr:MAG TPA: ERF superfamily protein [Caudoviricetes sp.]
MANGMKKLLNIIAKLEVGKSHKNNFGNYSYRNAEDILSGLKPLMVDYGVVVTIEDDLVLIGDRYYVKATVTAYDTEDGSEIRHVSAFAREALSKKGMDEAQVTGAASSYARKYALAGMFNLSPAKDLDELPPEPEKRETPKPLTKHHTAEELINLIAWRGIDPKVFVRTIYPGFEIGTLTEEQIDNAVMNFYGDKGALDYYLACIGDKK